jgi:hypothetical protein
MQVVAPGFGFVVQLGQAVDDGHWDCSSRRPGYSLAGMRDPHAWNYRIT